MNVSAVIVTRGDVDLSPVLNALPREWQKVVWDNSQREDLAVYGRYAAISECEHETVFVVDDDCVLETPLTLLSVYEHEIKRSPGAIVANMPARFRHDFYSDHCLVGFGAIFQRELPAAAFARFRVARSFGKVFDAFVQDPGIFSRTCDIVFTSLTPRILLDLPYTDLPWASAPNRMWKQPEHVGERKRMLELAQKVRDA